MENVPFNSVSCLEKSLRLIYRKRSLRVQEGEDCWESGLALRYTPLCLFVPVAGPALLLFRQC